MVFLTHPTGNQFVKSALRGLKDHESLLAFHTAVASFPGSMLHRIGQINAFKEINRREFDADLKSLTYTSPSMEIGRLAASKFKWNSLIAHEHGRFSVDNVFQHIDRISAKMLIDKKLTGLKAVYSYEDGALYTFRQALNLNLVRLYDLPIGYWRAMRQLLGAERECRPDWATTLKGFKDSEAKLQRKDEELRLAQHIFVASSFTKKTLELYPGTLAPIHVIPYAFPEVAIGKTYSSASRAKLRLLFVGGLSQRKGIANVLEAVEGLGNHVELTIVGRKAVEGCIPLDAGLRKHRWIPTLSHQDILKLMREQDVLLFPSLFEGFGLVITEAMSQGTPVITTDRTAGPDLIVHDENGWLVQAGNTDGLKRQIEALLSKPALIKANGLAAIETAKKRPWEKYGTELALKIKEVIAND
ncbi:glycosyltransferase family 4 protein [Parapedobacter sp. ISTM3]|uniref:glycosyltransferase family 4 protein n=1 Tax=Parapedobacter sp. ISTM3 TaxID=2800130 RepID=UPI001902ED8F|nr:glycosyltransferase family 4 protein [Parapedobacter sp. ISTM3]MBK1441657.1 glycosyltransferase family 4 protein [Parapedobacter sp. ISTM3]